MTDKTERDRTRSVLAAPEPENTMKIDRMAAFAPRTRALASELAMMQGPCVGCTECDGMCQELIEALVLPDAILKKGGKS